VQKIIAKYGLAAHLALLAVAPLFLFPFYDAHVIAIVLLWLTFPAALWVLLQPSLRHGEMMHNARSRNITSIFHDPLFWTALTITGMAGIRALNTGIEMLYDAENSSWQLAQAIMPLFPASCNDCGFLPFAVTVAFTVIVTACRHSLGRAARQSYLLVSSLLAGIAAVIALYQANIGNPLVLDALSCPMRDMSFIGCAFGIHLASGIVALTASIENRWNRTLPLSLLSIGATLAGMIAFAPSHDIALFSIAAVVVLLYSFLYCMFSVKSAAEFKFVIFITISLVFGYVFLAATIPMENILARLSVIADGKFFQDGYLAARKTLSAIAVKSWVTKPWTGSGLGSFILDIRFNATQSDWASIPRGIQVAPFGYLTLIAERGIVGAAFFALPALFLIFTFLRRLVNWLLHITCPTPGCWMGPAVLLSTIASAFFDCSFMRADVILAAGGVLALSASSFPKAGGGR
jgi:hypothetical protein